MPGHFSLVGSISQPKFCRNLNCFDISDVSEVWLGGALQNRRETMRAGSFFSRRASRNLFLTGAP